MNKIDTVKGREALAPRRDPYWQRLTPGCYLGVRRMAAGSEGTWIARAVDETTGKKPTKPLGEFAELPGHQRYAAAKAAAEDWFTHLGKGGSAASTTVKDVCDRYVTHLKATKTAKAADDADKRFKAYVLNDARLASTEVGKLNPAIIEKWRKALQAKPTTSGGNRGQVRTPSTLNRDMSCFRAALNLAYLDGLLTSDFAWRAKMRPLKNVDKRRELYLDKDQRRKFVEAAAPDLALFLKGLSLLPLRPGALSHLTVASFDKRLGVLSIGKDKSGHDRNLKLPKKTSKFFEDASKDKLPGAPLLARADGQAWNKDAWKWPVKAAVEAGELPEGTTAYTLRHSTITDLVHGGLDLLTVGQISGTSVRMIEKNYGHLRGNVAADALAKLAL